MEQKHAGIVVAAGKGRRFGGDIPKQYLNLCGKPVLCHCLDVMEKSFLSEVVLVVAKGDEDYCANEIVEKYHYAKVTEILAGGAERSQSVANALNSLSKREIPPDFVYIQDGARPFLTLSLLESLRDAALASGASVAAKKVTDTIKTTDDGSFVKDNLDRSKLCAVQTP
ncbi:MAG: 2-C-methyl-D-erythritol 4-phosphate cytidylyltransferase, partial [Lachnospiraceae bacterium]|nr:2-C-methyl-D-erythritol 4-phosphate cytidylyltransferase [Lachnospiraceae bacterium]